MIVQYGGQMACTSIVGLVVQGEPPAPYGWNGTGWLLLRAQHAGMGPTAQPLSACRVG